MFVKIKKAVKILRDQNENEDVDELRDYVVRGEISAYIKTPKISETPGYNDGADIDIFRVPCSLGSFFDQRLSEYCKIVDPVWEDGRISFTTIVVTDFEGKSPTRKNPYYTDMSNPSGKIGPGGKVMLHQGWEYEEMMIRFDKEEIQRYAATKKKEMSKINRILRKLYPQAEMIWEAVKAEKKKTSLPERLIEVALAERNKYKFSKIKRKFFESEVLKTRLAPGKKPKRDFIGTLLQLALLEEGINANSYADIYEEAIKLVSVS